MPPRRLPRASHRKNHHRLKTPLTRCATAVLNWRPQEFAMGSVATQADLRNEATDEVLGTLAHELRQPLSNIEAIAYYLSMILPPGDAKIQPQLARIRELVEQSNLILSSALGLETAPAAGPQSVTPDA